MKVGLVIQHADPKRGGAERYTIDIAHALSHRGHDVAILASTFADDVPWEIRQIKLEGRGFGKAMAYARFLNFFDQHLQNNSYDIIHAMLPVRWCDLYHPHAGLAAAPAGPRPCRRWRGRLPFAMASTMSGEAVTYLVGFGDSERGGSCPTPAFGVSGSTRRRRDSHLVGRSL